MKGSKQSRRDAKQLFQSCQVDGALDEARVRQAVALLIEKKPRGYFGTLQEFQRLVKLDVNSRSARVESAVALSEAQQQEVRAQENQDAGSGDTRLRSARGEHAARDRTSGAHRRLHHARQRAQQRARAKTEALLKHAHGFLRTEDSVASVSAGQVATSLLIFMIVYAIIFTAGTVYMARKFS